MNALLAQFIPEARELLEQAGSGLLTLERDAGSQTAVNDVFRAVHTLKGSSGLFDLSPLTRLVHAAEDLLGEVRTGELALNSEIVDRLLDSLDLVAVWIDCLESKEALPGDAEANMTSRVAVMRQWLRQPGPGAPDRGLAAPGPKTLAAPDWLIDLPEMDRIAAWTEVRDRPLLAWAFTPEEDCFFRGDDPLALVRSAPGVMAVRVRRRDAGDVDVASLDPLACSLRIEVLSDAPREGLEEHMRYVADEVEIALISPQSLALPSGEAASGPVFTDFADAARERIAAADAAGLARSVAAVLKLASPKSLQASALRWAEARLARDGLSDPEALMRLIRAVETGSVAEMMDPASAVSLQGDPSRVEAESGGADAQGRLFAGRLAREQISMLEIAADPSLVDGCLESAARVLTHIALAIGQADVALEAALGIDQWRQGNTAPLRSLAGRLAGAPPPMEPQDLGGGPDAPDGTRPPEDAPGEVLADARPANRMLRIDQSKIDAIMNLVAELIVAKNGLSYVATRAEQVHGARHVAREIKDQFAVIDRITQGLQVGVMTVRMMPVGQVFQRFPRLVRDVSRKLGKKIDLIIEGEDTEADKNVLESLADPLIHMLRNSLDHGVETPEARLAAGKPEQGTVRITARQENDFVVIEVRDDGCGIDPARVKDKALKLGLVSVEKAAQMSDEEAVNLVFAAGFSTKEEISDLSGRGVGMDVVRTAVIKAGGEVSLRSTLGSGTSVTLRLPLTMAVTRIVTVTCRGRIFGIPMDQVVETVRVSQERIHRIKMAETFVLRDSIIPIVRLERILALRTADEAPVDEEAVMVVKLGQDRIGLIVDGFRERLEVIVKPLEGVLEGLAGFSGTALLGDGRVFLVLDLKEIL